MNEYKGKILGSILFIVLISVLIFLIFSSGKIKDKGKIEMIKITGNNLLSEKDYRIFTKLNDPANYIGLTLPVIKDRFEKHPYVAEAEVEYAGNHEVIVKIEEKKMMAVLLSGSEPYLITENFQVLPLLSDTRYVDLPVISHPEISKPVQTFKKMETSGVLEAFKIIDAAKLTNLEIFKHLSEINLRNGGDIILTLSGIKPPVIFGRGEVAKKIVYLDIMLEGIVNGKSLLKDSDYIDLRFANEIYLGQVEKTGLSE